MKFRKKSDDVLYVPSYLRILSLREKILLASLVLLSSITLGSIPLVYALANMSETAPNPIYSSEVELWRVFGEQS